MTRDELRETLQKKNWFIRLRDGAIFTVLRVHANDNYEFLIEYQKLNKTLTPGRKRTADLVTFCRKYAPWK